LAIFAAVVEEKSFSAAAKQLGMSKSAVSKQVGKLEDRLGARLLNRTTRRLSLTEVGSTFYEHCARILEEADAAEAAVTLMHDRPRGTLRINAPVSFGILHLAPAICDFLEENQEITIDMTLDDRFVDLVEEGYDVAVRIGDLKDSSLIARNLAPCRFVVCATPAYLERHGTPTVPQDLTGHNCLIYTYRNEPEWCFTDASGDRITVKLNGSFHANNGDALRAAALEGLGILGSPTFIIGDDLRNGRLVPILTEFTFRSATVNAVYPHRRHLSPKVRVFVDFVAQRFGPEPYWDSP
jgi:DNA-binding transcriptional LysR family regulator